jgi:hypothetical protein
MQCQAMHGRGFGPVFFVAGYGVSHFFHVHTYLVFAAGVEAHVEQ